VEPLHPLHKPLKFDPLIDLTAGIHPNGQHVRGFFAK